MIIRDLKNARFKKPAFGFLLRYIFKDQTALSPEGKGMFVYLKHVKGSTLSDWEDSFLDNERYRRSVRKNTVYLRHFVLSFEPADTQHLTGRKLLDMASFFIDTYHEKAQAVAAAHFDKDHVHVHICMSGIEYRSGRTIRHSKRGFAKFKQSVQMYQEQRYPELARSVVRHANNGKAKTNNSAEYHIQKRTGTTKKEQLVLLLRGLMDKADSLDSLLELLRDNGVPAYYRGGKLYGVEYEGRRYRFRTLGLKKELKQFHYNKHKKPLAQSLERET